MKAVTNQIKQVSKSSPSIWSILSLAVTAIGSIGAVLMAAGEWADVLKPEVIGAMLVAAAGAITASLGKSPLD
jgi:hypothetical protein